MNEFMHFARALLDGLQRLVWPHGAGAFRLWLALAVVVHHVTRIEIGKAPVLVFFALSGFWVRQVWQSRYQHTRAPWLTFWVSRWWRITPLLLLASVFSIAAHAIGGDADWALLKQSAGAQAVHAVIVLGYSALITRPVGPAWSLDVEMQFYLLVPVLVWCIRRGSTGLILSFAACCNIAALALGAGVSFPSFCFFFVLGVTAADRRWNVRPAVANSTMTLALVTFVATLLQPWGANLLKENAPYAALANVAWGAMLLPFALATVQHASDARDRWMGDQSYLVYLLHWPAIILMRFTAWGQQGGAVFAALLLAGVAVTCGLVWHGFDRPIDALRARWVKGRLVNSAAEPAPTVADARKTGDSSAFFA